MSKMGTSMKDMLQQQSAQAHAVESRHVQMQEQLHLEWKQAAELPDDFLEDFFESEMQETFDDKETNIWDFDSEPAPAPAPAPTPTSAAASAPAPVPTKKMHPLAARDTGADSDLAALANPAAPHQITCPSHPGVHCDMCKARPIVGPRFKCLNCPDFDMCFKCATTSNSHPPKHIFIEINQHSPNYGRIKARPCIAVDVQQARRGFHPNIACAECKMTPIAGPRYKCVVCDKYDVCKDCANKRREAIAKGEATKHHKGHSFVRIRMPWIRPQCTLWAYTPEAMRKVIAADCWEITQAERRSMGLAEQGAQGNYDPRPNPRPTSGKAKAKPKPKPARKMPAGGPNWGAQKPKKQSGGNPTFRKGGY